MKHPKQLLTVLLMGVACTLQAQRSETLLEKEWKFSKGDFKEASQPEFNDTQWESVVIPHDWAIFGPFDVNNDLQNVAVTQNFEKKASLDVYKRQSGNRHTFPNGEGRETGIVSIRKRQDRIHHRARGNLAGINKVILYSVQNLI